MSAPYRLVHWNRQKFFYDATIALLILLGTISFVAVSKTLNPAIPNGLLFVRCSAFLSFFLLQALLCIGPLARISARFYPLLYNRRHLGVTVFLLGSIHGATVLFRYQGGGGLLSLRQIFTAYAHEYSAAITDLSALRHIPFEPFGAVALLILFFLAATSHDFWLRTLGARTWKSLHVLAYVAYALVILHVAFGLIQSESPLVYGALTFVGLAVVVGLHVAAFFRGAATAPHAGTTEDGYIAACATNDLEEGQGIQAYCGRQPVALFRSKGRVYAVAGVCPHQGGPIGEGRIVDGLITCPWHGHQFQCSDGRAASPNCESLATYPLLVRGESVYIHPDPHPPGTPNEGALLTSGASRVDPKAIKSAEETFYIGHRGFTREAELLFSQVTALVLIASGALFMAAAAAGQSQPDLGAYARGETFTYTGVYFEHPLPYVYVRPVGADSGDAPGFHMLVAGQHSTRLPDTWHTAAGKTVQFDARPVYRENVVLLEVPNDRAPEIQGEPAPEALPGEYRARGTVTLQGELVDACCYLGAIRPGRGKLHRTCAIRCLESGGVPGIRVQSGERETVVLLATPNDGPLEYNTHWAGRKIDVRGSVFQTTSFLYIQPESIELSDG